MHDVFTEIGMHMSGKQESRPYNSHACYWGPLTQLYYRSHQNSPRTWSKRNIFNDHAQGFPGVDLGSKGGQLGVKQV